MVACTNITFDEEGQSMITRDCVNGTWMEDNYNGGKTNYSYLMKHYGERREDEEFRAVEIDYEQDITIYNRTKYVSSLDLIQD